MVTGAVRKRLRSGIRRCRLHGETALGQPVVDGQRQGERVALLWVEEQFHDDPIGPLVACFPAEPAGQAMNRVAPVGLGQRGLMGDVRELVAPVLQPVRPG